MKAAAVTAPAVFFFPHFSVLTFLLFTAALSTRMTPCCCARLSLLFASTRRTVSLKREEKRKEKRGAEIARVA